MSKAHQVNAEQLQQKLNNSRLPVLVDFFATWCPPCRALAPLLDQLAGDYAGKVEILKVNIDEENQLAQQFRVEAVPTLVLVAEGKIVRHQAGAPSRQALQKMLDEVLPATTP